VRAGVFENLVHDLHMLLREIAGRNPWMTRFQQLARDYERLAETLTGLHSIAFAVLSAKRFIEFTVQSA
jgi:hypothetical protein